MLVLALVIIAWVIIGIELYQSPPGRYKTSYVMALGFAMLIAAIFFAI